MSILINYLQRYDTLFSCRKYYRSMYYIIYAKYVAKNSVLQNENLEILTKKTDTTDNKYL